MNKSLHTAIDKGYQVTKDGIVTYKGKVRKIHPNSKGYLSFGVRVENKIIGVFVHKLQAYQKFGDKIFEKGIVVRHFDGNKINNSETNILIGTPSENMMDIPEHVRKRTGKNASYSIRTTAKLKVKEILEDRKKGLTYKDLFNKYGVPTSTLSYLFNEAEYARI